MEFYDDLFTRLDYDVVTEGTMEKLRSSFVKIIARLVDLVIRAVKFMKKKMVDGYNWVISKFRGKSNLEKVKPNAIIERLNLIKASMVVSTTVTDDIAKILETQKILANSEHVMTAFRKQTGPENLKILKEVTDTCDKIGPIIPGLTLAIVSEPDPEQSFIDAEEKLNVALLALSDTVFDQYLNWSDIREAVSWSTADERMTLQSIDDVISLLETHPNVFKQIAGVADDAKLADDVEKEMHRILKGATKKARFSANTDVNYINGKVQDFFGYFSKTIVAYTQLNLGLNDMAVGLVKVTTNLIETIPVMGRVVKMDEL